MKLVPLDSYSFGISNKINYKNRNIFFESVYIKTRITLHLLIYTVVIACRTRRRWAHSKGGDGRAGGPQPRRFERNPE
jgi:hypothetical protein